MCTVVSVRNHGIRIKRALGKLPIEQDDALTFLKTIRNLKYVLNKRKDKSRLTREQCTICISSATFTVGTWKEEY